MNISNIAAQLRDGRMTARQLASTLLDSIGKSELNCFISVDRSSVLEQADAADRLLADGNSQSPLLGIPIAVKDLIDVAGMRTTMGSAQFVDRVAAHDAKVVSSLRRAGAVILGKANTHEFAYGSTGDRSHFGPVFNPHDPSRVTGGSSSGSAASVAAGLSVAAIGTDTSASVRLPAALCGVVGLKPTYASLSLEGVFPLSHSLDHVGPITTTVSDNAILLASLRDTSATVYSQKIGKSVEGLKVGILGGYYAEHLSETVRDAIQKARISFKDAGATVIDIQVRDVQQIYEYQQLILRAEAYEVHKNALSNGASFNQEVRERLMTGREIDPGLYAKALASRGHAKQVFDDALSEVDVLLSATCGITAPKQFERTSFLERVGLSTFWLLTRLTAPTNWSGHPSLSIPFHKDAVELPIGVQLIARYHEEAVLYQAAHVLEAINVNLAKMQFENSPS